MSPAIGDFYIQRLSDHSDQWPRSGKLNLVVGPRRCGKSTLIWHTLARIGKTPIYIKCSELCFMEWCRSPLQFWSDLKTVVAKPGVIFFEEVQHLENAGLFLKGLTDLHSKSTLFATSDLTFPIGDSVHKALAGRVQLLRLLPFSLREWGHKSSVLTPALKRNKLEKKFQHMMICGSYPEVFHGDKAELFLSNLVEKDVVGHASDKFRIRYPAKFRKLLSIMASQIGCLVNFSQWASICGMDFKTTVNYASILEESYVIKLLPPYVGGKRVEIRNAPKVFFIDNGVRNLLISQFNNFELRADREILFENWVFSELFKNSAFADKLYYWRTKSGAGVNFVRQHNKKLTGFETKAVPMKQPRLARSSQSFINAYQPQNFYIVNMSLQSEMVIDKTNVRWLTHLDLIDLL